MDKNNQADNAKTTKSRPSKSVLIGGGLFVLVLIVVGLLLLSIGFSGDNNDADSTDIPAEETGVVEFYDSCKDDKVEEKPLRCYVDTTYPLDFLNQFQSQPDNCWIAVDGFAYDITPGENGYEYPGEGSLEQLCGQDASDRFEIDEIDPPGRDYLRGEVAY